MSWIRRETEKGAVQYICPHCHDYHEFREDFGERTFSENYIFCRRCGARNGTGNAPTLTPPNEPLPVLVNDEPDREYIDYICPRCKNTISQRRCGQRMETVYKCKFHDNCGQRVDWSNPQPYRRPPEGEA